VEGRRGLYGARKTEKISVAGHGAKFTLLTEDSVDYVLCFLLREKIEQSDVMVLLLLFVVSFLN
jgi:hypothetical protein